MTEKLEPLSFNPDDAEESRAESTKEGYLKHARSILKRYFEGDWHKVEVDICLQRFREDAVTKSAATVRRYKAALVFAIEERLKEFGHSAEHIGSLNETRTALLSAQFGGRSGTSTRVRNVGPAELDAMFLYLASQRSETARVVRAQLFFSTELGLRPSEWFKCDLQVTENNHTEVILSLIESAAKEGSTEAAQSFLDAVGYLRDKPELLETLRSDPQSLSVDLVVQNSKQTRGRSNGPTRTLLLDGLVREPQLFEMLVYFLLSLNRLKESDGGKSYVANATKILQRANENLRTLLVQIIWIMESWRVTPRDFVKIIESPTLEQRMLISSLRPRFHYRVKASLIKHLIIALQTRDESETPWLEPNAAADGFFRIMLYTGRHHFSARTKKLFDKVSVAALMGHATDETAGSYYAEPTSVTPDSGSLMVKPSSANVDSVRRKPRPEFFSTPTRAKLKSKTFSKKNTG